MAKINHKKVIVDGIKFDSQSEARYYQYLKQRKDIADIQLQPQYTLLEAFEVKCGRCVNGRTPSPKTDKLINCKTCRGTGKRKRQEWTYTADFLVTYKDGRQEVIDVKGYYRADKTFVYKRKMWEQQNGKELVVVEWDKKREKWVRK